MVADSGPKSGLKSYQRKSNDRNPMESRFPVPFRKGVGVFLVFTSSFPSPTHMRPIWTYNTDRPLSSECRKALEKLFESEGHWSRRLATGGVATSQSCRQGEITSFTHQVQVKDIPGGLLWRWNQTRARVLLTNEDGSSISVAKLRPRKRLTTSKSLDFNSMTGTIPSFKLWLFELKRADAFFVSVLWCQIGLQTDLLGHFPLHRWGDNRFGRPV